ncbi:MAG: 16S rRNA (uracil(1498)-N(3))-methyltransferase [Microbacteriaceae bacterium]|nr:16S rRNA (uracil(1498)-N(3))-methyltransferase [Microbacteriaceae bacterium]
MAHLYYDEALQDADFALGARFVISGDEAKHAVKVARLRAGEEILLGNGRGTLAKGEASPLAGGAAAFEFTVGEIVYKDGIATGSEAQNEPAYTPEIVLVQALAKGDRAERAVELCTELGVDSILPWAAKRSVSEWRGGDKITRGIQKWQKIAREAAKQSLRHTVPEIGDLVTLKNLCEKAAAKENLTIILDPWQASNFSEVMSRVSSEKPCQITLIVGPEGGITETEISELTAAGALTAVLGKNVLRTSTAGAAAIAVTHTALNNW